MNTIWPWFTLALLGAYHGINPAMGWLFAVALGLQERSRTSELLGDSGRGRDNERTCAAHAGAAGRGVRDLRTANPRDLRGRRPSLIRTERGQVMAPAM
jgi:hypothetical protein